MDLCSFCAPDLTPSLVASRLCLYLTLWSGAEPGTRAGSLLPISAQTDQTHASVSLSGKGSLPVYAHWPTTAPLISLARCHTHTGNNQSGRKWHKNKVARVFISTFLLLQPMSIITMLTLSSVDPTSGTFWGGKWGGMRFITLSCVLLQLPFSVLYQWKITHASFFDDGSSSVAGQNMA